jgi:hypothetical protein
VAEGHRQRAAKSPESPSSRDIAVIGKAKPTGHAFTQITKERLNRRDRKGKAYPGLGWRVGRLLEELSHGRRGCRISWMVGNSQQVHYQP